ncbi:MAG: hypothetical protein JWL59_3464 [Chthoniobacteraceae bacterium]|nr:hypothetical protein [Chthoniobacteraceae bacterium]
MSSKSPFDWVGFVVHFFFGALVGAAAGFGAWAKSPHASSVSMTPGFYYIGLGALICGLIAGWWGDHFWTGFCEWFRKW